MADKREWRPNPGPVGGIWSPESEEFQQLGPGAAEVMLQLLADPDSRREFPVAALTALAATGGSPCRAGFARGVPLVPALDCEARVAKIGGRLVFRMASARGGISTEAHVKALYAFPTGAVYLRVDADDCGLDYTTSDEGLVRAVEQAADDIIGEHHRVEAVGVLTRNARGFYNTTMLDGAACELERGNYQPGVVAGFDAAVADLHSAEPGGRFVVVSGPTGTGKTFLVRGVMKACPECSFMLLPASTAAAIAEPTLLTHLLSEREDLGDRPLVLIIEDADNALVPRMADNMSEIAALLNVTDGLIGRLIDLRVIATTNANGVEVDKALLRRGRLSAHIQTEELTWAEAMQAFQRLVGRDVGRPSGSGVSLADVYADARKHGYEPPADRSGSSRRGAVPRLKTFEQWERTAGKGRR